MSQLLAWSILVFAGISAILGAIVVFRPQKEPQGLRKQISDELRAGREESRTAARELREEITSNLKLTADTISGTLDAAAKGQQTQLDRVTKELKEFTAANHDALERIRGGVDSRIKELVESNQNVLDRIRNTIDERVKLLEEGNAKRIGEMRNEIANGAKSTSEALSKTLGDLSTAQQTQLQAVSTQVKEFSESNQSALEKIRATFDARVKELQEGNEKKLDEMRKTVDEKLQATLDQRLGESFKIVSDRLDAVHKGLGEMQTLATGVGDLKRVLTNVKARGTWAEVQLGALLEQVMTSEQYEKNVCVRVDSAERVEFAIRLPGRKDDIGSHIWLPIDSKFPQEDYLRLQDAADRADAEGIQAATESLARAVRGAAKDISEKYVNPPETTDFGIMFLATEGLYAEVLRQPALVEELQRKFRVVIAGPTTLVAILSSLRLGFQTLAIEQRASEVWRVLGAVKTEFGKFGAVLDKVKKQLNTASRTIDETGVRRRVLEKHLHTVSELPNAEASKVLSLDPVATMLSDSISTDDFYSDSEDAETQTD